MIHSGNDKIPGMLVDLRMVLPTEEKDATTRDIFINLCIDGSPYLAGLHLDVTEHHRRKKLGLAAVTSTGLLHALWELPHGVLLPREILPSFDLQTLDACGSGWIGVSDGKIVRHYQPPGKVHSIVVADKSLAKAVSRAARHPATVCRIAIWSRQSSRTNAWAGDSLRKAHSLGIGVISVVDGQAIQLVPPLDAMPGRPAIFRWWQAELAYRNWLKNTPPIVGAVALG